MIARGNLDLKQSCAHFFIFRGRRNERGKSD
nr:MAG TPA: hypothetical protein [Caudoviricetes sp.]